MNKPKWSEKDLVNKWGRKLPQHISQGLPWEVLATLAAGLSSDSMIPRDVLLECIRTRDVSGLFVLANNLDATVYSSADLLLQDRLILELFSKFDFANSPFNKREKALFRFFEAEEICREANFRVNRSLGLTTKVNSVLHNAIRKIDVVLGKFKLDEMLAFSRFGPGSTLCVTGARTTSYFKLACKSPTVSPECFPYAEALVNSDQKWKGFLTGINPLDIGGPFSPYGGFGPELGVADYNKVAFVPKNAKTERSIAIEPYFNVFFQLGVGGMIRQRLYRRAGINLDSQVRNQSLALKGSITDDLATIDFSMASDTISIETVRLLLPPSWFEHLDRMRSKNYKLDNSFRRYQKFSSMGNGFTFELETLIFFAVAFGACEHMNVSADDVAVYGDDVVIPSVVAPLFTEVCAYLGFKVNEEKSFVSGPFRESCGEDYLKGCRVRPVFCKELDSVQHVVSLANRLSALNRTVGVGSRLNDSLVRAVALLHEAIPRDVRRVVVGPPSENFDSHIHCDDFETLTRSELVRWRRDLFAWEYPTISFRARELRRRDGAVALLAIWQTAPNRAAISRQDVIVAGLQKLARRHRVSDFSDLLEAGTQCQITARKVGKLSLGRSVAWSLRSSFS